MKNYIIYDEADRIAILDSLLYLASELMREQAGLLYKDCQESVEHK